MALTAEAAETDCRAGHRNNRRLALDAPSAALHRIGTKTGFIPEINLRSQPFGPCRKARIGGALPGLDRCRVALIGAHQRLLRRQSQIGKQLAHRGEAQLYAKPVSNQFSNDLTRPQTKIKTILTRILAVDPTKDLPFLRRCQLARTACPFARTQSSKTAPSTLRPVQPFVDRRAAKAVADNDRAWLLALTHPFNSHSPDFLQRLMIQLPSIALHVASCNESRNKSSGCILNN